MGDAGPVSPEGQGRQEQRGRPRFKVEGALAALGKPGMLSSLGLGLKREDVVNLSQSGVLVVGRAKLEPGARVRVRLDVPKWSERIECDGEVRWCAQSARREKEFYVGVRFLGLSAADERRIGQMRELSGSAEYRAKAAARKEASSSKLPRVGDRA